MIKYFLLFISLPLFTKVKAQIEAQPENDYFITTNKQQYIQKLKDLSIGIRENDKVATVIAKLGLFLKNYKANKEYSDDAYALAANLQAWKSIKEGGYGIGAVLVDEKGNIISRNHNNQLQKKRSDLHGEMSLLTDFESSPLASKYMHSYKFKKGVIVFSSAEPCPMCFIRLATAGVATKYCTPGPDDGMVSRVQCLPTYWRELGEKASFSKGNCSPIMQKLAHLLFFSYLLDGRGPN